MQVAAMRFAPRATGRLPVVIHRHFLRRLGVRVEVVGAPERNRPLMLVSNHVSWLDIPVLGSLFPLSFVAKREVGTWPGIGTMARLQRTIFIDRERRRHTREVNREIAGRLAAGDAIVLFAEGTTGDGNRVLPFRSSLLGAVRDAIAEADHDDHTILVQPVSIAYTHLRGVPVGRAGRHRLAWYGDMELADHLPQVIGTGAIDVTVSFGTPLPATRDTDRKALTAAIEQRVRGLTAAALTGRRHHAG
jgi:1-acyl-sn-glycerol-3-phosphate acyltransferase